MQDLTSCCDLKISSLNSLVFMARLNVSWQSLLRMWRLVAKSKQFIYMSYTINFNFLTRTSRLDRHRFPLNQIKIFDTLPSQFPNDRMLKRSTILIYGVQLFHYIFFSINCYERYWKDMATGYSWKMLP